MYRNMNSERENGFTLVELLVAMALGLMIMLIMTQVFGSMKLSYRAQEGLARVQEDGRIAMHFVAREVRKSGFRAPVWNEPLQGYHPLTAASVEGNNGADDTLQIMYQDNVDCLGVLNTSIDPETTEARALYKRITFSVAQQMLRWTCEYGATPLALTAQLTNQNIIDGVESFQVLYGIDTDFPPDFSVNSWTTADNITIQSTVCLQSSFLCETEGLINAMQAGVPLAVTIGMLVASPGNAGSVQEEQQTFNVLGVSVPAAADQRLRKLFTSTVTIRNLTL